MQTFFEPSSAHTMMARWYDEQLDEYPLACELMRLETSFGDTQLIKTGNLGGPPLLMLHEALGCAPLMLSRYELLAQHYCLYVPDLIGEPGLSAAFRPEAGSNDYGQWLVEVISWLKLTDVSLLACGLGGYVGLQALQLIPTRFRQATLVSPLGIVTAGRWARWSGIWLPQQMYRWFQQEDCLNKNIAAWYTTVSDCPRALFANTLLHFHAPERSLQLFTDQQLRAIKCPINLVASEADLQVPAQALLGRGQRLLPQLKQTLLLPQGRHIPKLNDRQLISDLLYQTE